MKTDNYTRIKRPAQFGLYRAFCPLARRRRSAPPTRACTRASPPAKYNKLRGMLHSRYHSLILLCNICWGFSILCRLRMTCWHCVLVLPVNDLLEWMRQIILVFPTRKKKKKESFSQTSFTCKELVSFMLVTCIFHLNSVQSPRALLLSEAHVQCVHFHLYQLK